MYLLKNNENLFSIFLFYIYYYSDDLWEWLILALLCYRAVVDYIIYPALIRFV